MGPKIEGRGLCHALASLAIVVATAAGCSPGTDGPPADTFLDGDAVVPCPESMDTDGDRITNEDEAWEDMDLDDDGLQNQNDDDSDGDTIPDSLEAGDDDCATPPVDSDEDTEPDFLDRDADGNRIADRNETTGDLDGDDVPDFADMDDDGDNIDDAVEVKDYLHPENDDYDGDTIADYHDEDSDGDTIKDFSEGERDPDVDGIPAYLDDDSDGDGMIDADEAGDEDPETPPIDFDTDGIADFLDIDSDGDGLSDGQEMAEGTDPHDTDTDGDGFDDLAEWAHPDADPTDPLSGIPADDYYVVLPPHEDPVERDLDFGTDIQVADIFFLIDTTGSMYAEIDVIIDRLTSYIIPEITTDITNAAFGVGYFADFPLDPWGSAGDVVFDVAQIMTTVPADALAAVEALPRLDGGDHPESQVEALYQTVTGEGLTGYVDPHVCPDGVGAACFRPGALPIILLLTDAPMHNGPLAGAGSAYTGISPAPHAWNDAIAELNDVHAKVIGLDSEPLGLTYARFDMVRTATVTGTVDDAGDPLVFDIGEDGEYLDATVVNAVATLASHVSFDVDTYVVDHPDGYEDIPEVDASCFVKARIPQEGWVPPVGYAPEEAVDHIDGTTFYGVIPGTSVTFLVRFQNHVDDDTACYEGDIMARVFLATIVVRGDGVTDLDDREVVIIVPARPPELG